jgi:hypothetical protein
VVCNGSRMSERTSKGGTPRSSDSRAERLGAALRQNLRRRKEAVRSERRDEPKPNPPETGGNPPKDRERG